MIRFGYVFDGCCRGRGDKNREDDFRGEKWSGRWKEDNNIGSLRLRRWLINQGRRWENSLTCNLRTMYRAPSSFYLSAYRSVPFFAEYERRLARCARIFFTESYTPSPPALYRDTDTLCGNPPTLNVNCCLNLWQSASPRLSTRTASSQRHRPTPSLHPNNPAYSFRQRSLETSSAINHVSPRPHSRISPPRNRPLSLQILNSSIISLAVLILCALDRHSTGGHREPSNA